MPSPTRHPVSSPLPAWKPGDHIEAKRLNRMQEVRLPTVDRPGRPDSIFRWVRIYGGHIGPDDEVGECKTQVHDPQSGDGDDFIDDGSAPAPFYKGHIPQGIYLENELYLAIWNSNAGAWVPVSPSHITQRLAEVLDSGDEVEKCTSVNVGILEEPDDESGGDCNEESTGVEVLVKNPLGSFAGSIVWIAHDGKRWRITAVECVTSGD